MKHTQKNKFPRVSRQCNRGRHTHTEWTQSYLIFKRTTTTITTTTNIEHIPNTKKKHYWFTCSSLWLVEQLSPQFSRWKFGEATSQFPHKQIAKQKKKKKTYVYWFKIFNSEILKQFYTDLFYFRSIKQTFCVSFQIAYLFFHRLAHNSKWSIYFHFWKLWAEKRKNENWIF